MSELPQDANQACGLPEVTADVRGDGVFVTVTTLKVARQEDHYSVRAKADGCLVSLIVNLDGPDIVLRLTPHGADGLAMALTSAAALARGA